MHVQQLVHMDVHVSAPECIAYVMHRCVHWLWTERLSKAVQ